MQEQIDICLNCTKPRCVGTCKLVSDKELKMWIIKRTTTLKNSVQRTSYIACLRGNKIINSGTNIFRAKRFTMADAKKIAKKLQSCAKENVKFEIVERNVEIENISNTKKKNVGNSTSHNDFNGVSANSF